MIEKVWVIVYPVGKIRLVDADKTCGLPSFPTKEDAEQYKILNTREN